VRDLTERRGCPRTLRPGVSTKTSWRELRLIGVQGIIHMRKTFAGILVFLGAIALTADTGHDYRAFGQKLSKEDQALDALERLTFGTRPGDLEAVKKMGVKKWIDLQLHPEQIAENPELEERLKPLESLRMSAPEIVQAYPPRQAIRAIANGKLAAPQDP